MGNEKIIRFYDKLAQTISDPKATRNKAKDFSKFDIQLMKSLGGKDKTLLDLGSGTGLLVNHIVDDFKMITAVEKYPEFSRFITKTPKIRIINEDILNLQLSLDHKYDIVSLFGVMPYFDYDEAILIYDKVKKYIKDDGILIVKNQFGVKEDVVVNGFSEELKTNYYSEYRHVEKEKNILIEKGFSNVEVIDIYPAEYNRWDNTHFYALICSNSK